MNQHSELFMQTGKLLNLPDSSSTFGTIEIERNGKRTGKIAKVYSGSDGNSIDSNVLQKLINHFGRSTSINAKVYFFLIPRIHLLNSSDPENEDDYFLAVNVFPYSPTLIPKKVAVMTGEPCCIVIDPPPIPPDPSGNPKHYLCLNSFMELVTIKTAENLKPYDKLIVTLSSMHRINSPWSPSYIIKEYSLFETDNRFKWSYKDATGRNNDVPSFY